MDGKSRWADNIMIERWFRSLKVEELYPNEYTTPKALRKAISEYIRQYNNERPHEAIGYRKPADVFSECFGACVETFSTGYQTQEFLNDYVRDTYDLTSGGIIEKLGFLDVDYNKVSAYGHFGKDGLPWEK